MKREDFTLTPEQKRAFNKVVKAIKDANKVGISFYAKSDTLCAYQEKAMEHAAPLHSIGRIDYTNPIPHESASVLADSGADDTEYFEKGFITE